MTPHTAASAAAALAFAALAFPAQSASSLLTQGTYPTKPIRLIVAFPPGGSTDIIARLVGQRLSERLGQQVIIDNRGGAGGTIGTEIAARANPDGYTLTMGTTSTHVIAPAAYSKISYDPVKDFVPITLVASTPYLLVLNPGVKATTLKNGEVRESGESRGREAELEISLLPSGAGELEDLVIDMSAQEVHYAMVPASGMSEHQGSTAVRDDHLAAPDAVRVPARGIGRSSGRVGAAPESALQGIAVVDLAVDPLQNV